MIITEPEDALDVTVRFSELQADAGVGTQPYGVGHQLLQVVATCEAKIDRLTRELEQLQALRSRAQDQLDRVRQVEERRAKELHVFDS
jgi:hypothetical protein